MLNSGHEQRKCCSQSDGCTPSPADHGLQPIFAAVPQDEPCCGAPPGPESSSFERPGYQLVHFVEDFIDTPIGKVPRVKISLDRRDLLGSAAVRLGFKRDQYKIAPGIYAVGNPGQGSPVLVTANYKLSFDRLRKELTAIDAWILVLDTRGINVWCAAGKYLFGTAELVRRVQQTLLNRLVRHRQLILPQLAATGVSALRVKKACGFSVLWGPIRARDLWQFIANGLKADEPMRRVTFSMLERIVLLPVELAHLPKPSAWVLLVAFLLSGIGTHLFSFNDAWIRGLRMLSAYGAGILAGAVAAPILLPWLPGRAFALKGLVTGAIAGAMLVLILKANLIWTEAVALFLLTLVVSSYLAMNFTGATPFTSPSGVEKEMRTALPLQLGGLLTAVAVWIGSAFTGQR